MDVLFNLKKNKINLTDIFWIIITFLTLCEVLQNRALLFNPLIIAFMNVTYLFSLKQRLITFGATIFTGLIINVNFGIELILLGLLNLLMSIISNNVNRNFKAILLNLIPTFILMIIYCFLVKSPSDYINLIISFCFSLFNSILLSICIKDIDKLDKMNPSLISFLLIIFCLCFIKINSIAYLIIACIYAYCLKIKLYDEVIVSCFPFIAILYFLYNIPLGFIIALFMPFFLIAISKTNRYLEIINFFLFTIMMFVYDQEFYLKQEYYQSIGGILIAYLIPKYNFKCEEKNNDFDRNKLQEIKSFCSLMEDKRFSRYTDLNKVLLNEIESGICLNCKNKNNCILLNENIISSYINENIKKEIIDKCLYSYQVIKKLCFHNQLYFEFNNNQTTLVEHNANLIKPYSIIKKMIDDNNKDVTNIKYKLDIETISVGFSMENGDCYDFIDKGNYKYIVLSDGMGHQKESKEVSSYLVSLIKMMIPYEENVFSLIKDANKIMLSKTYEEVYATLDIAKFDLEKGQVELFKAGSFSTFFIRNKVVKEYAPLLPPIGIINNVREKEEVIKFESGDIFIFMTDGFGEFASDIVIDTVQKSTFLNLHNYVKFLFNKLKENKCDDDKTIIGVKIR